MEAEKVQLKLVLHDDFVFLHLTNHEKKDWIIAQGHSISESEMLRTLRRFNLLNIDSLEIERIK